GVARRGRRPLRARARDGPGHRGEGDRQPDRGDPVGGDAVALRARSGEGRRAGRARGAEGPRGGAPHRRHRPRRDENGGHAGDGGPDREGAGGPILMASGVTVAAVGATGAAGQMTLRILEERKFPVRELRAFASERSVGKTVTFRGETLAPRHFPHRIAFNLIPAIDRFEPNGYTGEEMKLVNETRKILETPDLPIAATSVRVPVFTCHSVAVTVETETKLAPERARALVERFPGLRLWDDPAQERYPMPIDVEGQDECFVGRIREDLSSPTGLCFWVVGDQLRKGAATNAVQLAVAL